MNDCELSWVSPCKGPIEHHHIISKQNARGNRKMRKAIDAVELIAKLCHKHHFKLGRNTKYRGILLRQKAMRYGEDHMRQIVNSLPWKVQPHEFTWDALVG